jgi:hypothetical protein
MDELLDMIISDQSPSQVSDAIKNMLFTKSAEKVENIRPQVANSFFNAVVDNE